MTSKTLIVLTENYVNGGANKYAEDIINSIENHYEKIEIWCNESGINSFNKTRLPSRTLIKSLLIFNLSEYVKTFSRPVRLLLKLILLPLNFLINLYSYIGLFIKLAIAKPTQVILCNGGYPASIYLVLAFVFIRKKYNPSMTIVSTPTRKEHFYWKYIDYIVQKKAKRLVVNSKMIKNNLVKGYNFSSELIDVIHNGIDDNKVARIENNNLTIGFISRVESSKGIHELLSAYQKLKQLHPTIELLIAGSGSAESDVLRAIAKDPSIQFLGHITSGIEKILARIDIYVLPSYQEGLPYSVIEACMASCAVVATDVGGIPEIITHNVSGLLIPAKDDNALFLALEKLTLDNELRLKLAQNARISFLNHFTLKKMKENSQVLCS